MKISESLLNVYINEFHNHGEAALIAMCNCMIPADVILHRYQKLPPIEQLNEKEKKELKQYVIESFPGKPLDFLVRASKIVYTIGTLI